jgi:ABC-2 type transport system ATP-binding protein
VDPVGRQELLTLFRGLAADGKGILISSHELEELERLTNHVIVMARGRVAAVGTLQRIRDLMDDLPLSIRIDVDRPRDLARRLLELDEVMGADVVSDAVAGPRVIVRACHPQRFFRELGRIVLAEQMDVHRIEPLDESAHAVLGYLLGGSGKT